MTAPGGRSTFCIAHLQRETAQATRDGDADRAAALLKEAEGYLYAIRLPSNAVLHREIEHLLTRPVGRPPNKPVVWYHDFLYQPGSWDRPRRVVAKIEWHKGELFPRVGFIVTKDETAPGRGGHREGLPGSAEDTGMQAISDGTTAWKLPEAPSTEPGKCLLIPRIVIESLKRLTAVVGKRYPGNSE